MSMVSTTGSSFDRMDIFCRGAFGVLFGEQITALREEQELTIELAAGRADMTPFEWLRVERGRVPESWELACRMADALGISHFEMAALIVRHSKAWGEDGKVPAEISKIYS